jgi:two-component system OmpR family response regulator
MRVLIVEDEVKMASLIRRGLRDDGMAADVAIRGEDGLWMAGSTEYDTIVLDVMLPAMDGFELCRRLREDGVRAPVLMLTARDAIEDRIAGLDGGADDYLTKPFSFAELLARLRALVRRGPVQQPTVLQAGDLNLDPSSKRVWRGSNDIGLSAKEFSLLETFMRRPGHVLDRYHLLEHAWDYEYENRSNVVDVYVGYLRQKIDRPFGVGSIETVRGAGYRMRADGGTRRGVTGRSRDFGARRGERVAAGRSAAPSQSPGAYPLRSVPTRCSASGADQRPVSWNAESAGCAVVPL